MTTGTQAKLPKDHPLRQAWDGWKNTNPAVIARQWAQFPQHVDGSLWAAFSAGFTVGRAPEKSLSGDIVGNRRTTTPREHPSCPDCGYAEPRGIGAEGYFRCDVCGAEFLPAKVNNELV